MPPPGIPGGPWPGGPPAYGPVMKDEGLRTKWLIAAGVSVLVIMAVLAVVYFLVLNKKTEATGPEGAVLKYFDAISAGDVEALKSMYSPETMPPQASLDMIGQLFGTGMIKYEDIKLKTIKETATDAEVQLLDARITVTVGGQKTSSNVSDGLDPGQAIFKLKMVNGYWLIYQDGQSPVDLDIPAFPGGAAPSGG